MTPTATLKIKRLKVFLSLLIILSPFVSVKAQIAYSPYVDSIQQRVDTSNLKLIIRQLSGDTIANINGQDTVIFTRVLDHPHNALAAEYIRERFEEYGYTPETQYFNDNLGENIIATKVGTVYPEKKYIICAHYDSHCYDSIRAPGADDNASGTAAVLEIARLLQGINFDYTVHFITWDEEETGLWGSAFYVEQALLNGDDIVGVVNLDMIGYDANNDGVYMITYDSLSNVFKEEFLSVALAYYPSLEYKRGVSGSDQYSFMEHGYKAIGITEDLVDDFNEYYHSIFDIMQNFNLPYYYTLVKTAASFILSQALDFKFNLQHTPLESGNYTVPVQTSIMISGFEVPSSGINVPRLYYSTDSITYNYLTPIEVNADTFFYELPELPLHSWVNYYFAAQDTAGSFVITYPTGGRGFNPPGNIPPIFPFTFYVDYLGLLNPCSENIPVTLPPHKTTYDTIAVNHSFKIFDIDVLVDIKHGNVNDLRIDLISPDSSIILLSNDAYYNGDNFTQTIFDDEAELNILEGVPPFTGRFKPIQSLSILDNTSMEGLWQLRCSLPSLYYTGILNEWCLHFTYHDTTTSLMEFDINRIQLKQNYPNPATDYTNIEFELSKAGNVTLYLTDITGNLVKTILSGIYSSGNHLVVLTLQDLQPGVYFYTLKTDRGICTKKILKE